MSRVVILGANGVYARHLIPRLVRLRLRMQDENSPWPELVAAPRLGAMMQPTPLDADPGVEGVEGAEE